MYDKIKKFVVDADNGYPYDAEISSEIRKIKKITILNNIEIVYKNGDKLQLEATNLGQVAYAFVLANVEYRTFCWEVKQFVNKTQYDILAIREGEKDPNECWFRNQLQEVLDAEE